MRSYADVYLTPDQVAERLQVDTESVRRWLRTRKLRGSRISPKAWRISEQDLAAFLAQKASEPAQKEQAATPPDTLVKPNFAEFLRNSPLAG